MTGACHITFVQGDITQQEVDVIVNAANSGLRGGGGVDGAIHRAGGPAIMSALAVIRDARGGCPTGQAVTTVAGDLSATHVVHAVGPIWHGGTKGEEDLLRSAYQNSLAEAEGVGGRVVAFPSISTGVYSYPLEQAAIVALRAIKDYITQHPKVFDEIRFVLFSDRDFSTYQQVYNEM